MRRIRFDEPNLIYYMLTTANETDSVLDLFTDLLAKLLNTQQKCNLRLFLNKSN